MEKLERFKAWVGTLTGWKRWLFAFLLALLLIGAAIFFTFFRARDAGGNADSAGATDKSASGPTQPDPGEDDRRAIDRIAGEETGRVDGLVSRLPELGSEGQDLESRAGELVESSQDLIKEANRRSGQAD